MAELVLLVVAAAWAAVLIPPLLRSRIENRPNSSVTDFRNQLYSLQRTMPSRSVGPMRGMARPLAPSPLARPAAAGRPAMRSGVRTHGPIRTPAPQPAARTSRNGAARMHEASPRHRVHNERTAAEIRTRRQSAARDLDHRDIVRRRRANVLFVLVLAAGCSLFLAATTEATGMLYVFALSFVALCGYVYLLGQYRQREEWVPAEAPVAPAPRPAAANHRVVHREPRVRRERMTRRDRSFAV